MKYIFGPIPSRRLGLSLGVDIVPLKTCTLSCIYCQVGKTPVTTVDRREYIPVKDILAELKTVLEKNDRLDWISFSGSGEPTLHSGIGEIIDGIRELTDTPICVITNGTLLWDVDVRRDILKADAVMPSLDSAFDPSFQAINRPHDSLDVKRHIEGLVSFREEFTGSLWLEIMFVAGLNDSEDDIAALVDAVERIRPDRIQLNTVVRPPAESTAQPLTREKLEEIRARFGNNAEIIASFKSTEQKSGYAGINEIRDYLQRRPGSIDDLSAALGIDIKTLEVLLFKLEGIGEIEKRDHRGTQYWEYKQDI